jgi:hypothetical protein
MSYINIWDAIDNHINKSLNLLENSKDKNESNINESNINESNINKSKQNTDTKVKDSISKSIQEDIIVYITRDGTYIKTKNISPEIEKKISKYYTIKSKNIMGFWNKTNNFYHINDKLFIPRFGSFSLIKKFPNIKYINKIESKNYIPEIQWNGIFKGNQKIVFDYIIENNFSCLNKDIGNAGIILNLEAGQGKTFVAMGLISHLKCRTLIVVHNTTILFQWVELLEKYFPNQNIGVYYGKKKKYGDIIVGVINSLVMKEINFKDKPFDKPCDFYKNIDFCIFDESHEYCSQTRNKIFRICQSPYMLGLSATPNDREDNLDKIIKWNIGKVLCAKELSGYTEENIKFTGSVHMIKYYGPIEYTKPIINEKLEMTSVPLMIKQLAEDPYRLKIIIDCIFDNLINNLNIFVFADNRSYLELIHSELEKNKNNNHNLCLITNDNEFNAMTIMGGCLSEDMNKAEKNANIILTTYQFMGTGKSIPKMNCIILTTPRKRKSRQFINRIFRLDSDYSINRIICDIVDMKTTLKNQWYIRKKYYEEKEYPIIEKKISYKDVILT